MDEDLAVGLHHLTHRAAGDDPYSRAVCCELARLYQAAGELVPAALQCYAPRLDSTEATDLGLSYAHVNAHLILRETCPRVGADDGPDALEMLSSAGAYSVFDAARGV